MSSFGPSVVSPTQAMSQQASPSPTSQSHPNAEGSVYAHQKWNVASQQPQLYLARLPPVAPASDSNSARSIQLGVPRPKRKRITPEQLEVLSNLFEYTDTPTFDLREAIGAKLGMSNREVQVWFQNRRAKVNRQRAPPTTQGTLQDRPVPSTSQQDPVRSSHGRLKSSSSELLLPSVSSLLQSSTDASSPTLSSAPLLPPFQPSVPGVSSIPDALGRPRRSQLATGSSSPRDIHGSDRPPQRPELQLRSPSGSHRRNNPNPPGSPYSRKWFPRRVPDSASHDRSACALSPRRSSTDPQPQSAILPDYLAAHHPARPRWSSPQETGSRDNLHATSHHAGFQHLNTIGPMPLDHSRQSDPAVTVNYHSMNVVPREREDNLEPSSASFARDFPSNNNQMSCSETNSSPRSISPPSHGPPAQNRQTWHSRGESMPSNELPPALRESRQESAEHGSLNLCCPPQHPSSFHQAKRSLSAEQPTSATPRSLFSSRYLPPLPNPVRPGPGSFPPPAALRVVPIRRGNVPPGHSSLSSSPSGSGFRLPPLLNDRPPDNDLLIPPCHPSQSR